MGAYKEVLEMGPGGKLANTVTIGDRHSTECTRMQTAHMEAFVSFVHSCAPGTWSSSPTPFCAYRLAQHAQYT